MARPRKVTETDHLLSNPANAERLEESVAQVKEGKAQVRELINPVESAPVTETHEIVETIKVDYLTPGHQPRGAESDLFRRSKRALEHMQARPLTLTRPEAGRCYICGKTEIELNEPLEAHHFSIEWSFANGEIDWKRVEEDHPRYHWDGFDPAKPLEFVDDMIEQGMLLCKKHHTGRDSGIHNLPFSIWIMQRYLKHGVKFSKTETIDKSKDWQ